MRAERACIMRLPAYSCEHGHTRVQSRCNHSLITRATCLRNEAEVRLRGTSRPKLGSSRNRYPSASKCTNVFSNAHICASGD